MCFCAPTCQTRLVYMVFGVCREHAKLEAKPRNTISIRGFLVGLALIFVYSSCLSICYRFLCALGRLQKPWILVVIGFLVKVRPPAPMPPHTVSVQSYSYRVWHSGLLVFAILVLMPAHRKTPKHDEYTSQNGRVSQPSDSSRVL